MLHLNDRARMPLNTMSGKTAHTFEISVGRSPRCKPTKNDHIVFSNSLVHGIPDQVTADHGGAKCYIVCHSLRQQIHLTQ